MNNVPEARSTDTSDDLPMYLVALSMHCGHCPKCGHLGQAEKFFVKADEGETVLLSYRDKKSADARYECPECAFTIPLSAAISTLSDFRSYRDRAVAIFEEHRRITAQEQRGCNEQHSDFE